MEYFGSEKLVIKSWCNEPEESCIIQAKNLANLPFAFKQICLMPDTHCGYGMPIGGVLATKDYVIPNAVGVDIGCGMTAVKTNLTEIDIDALKKIMGEIRKVIPVGFSHQACKQDENLMPEIPHFYIDEYGKPASLLVEQEYQSARSQLGTLGSGNHFIEIQKDDDGHIWIMLHSGSRNLGLKVANHYNRIATELNARWFSCVAKEQQLAFLPINSEEGQDYLAEMNYCVDFAKANRKLMMQNIKEVLYMNIPNLIILESFDVAHNYARMENHFGENVLVHRKGATSAKLDEIGIIPGSQGTASYIVKGLGNPESFMSCSHGAGRSMGRKEAKRSLNLEAEIKLLDDQGIVHGMRHTDDLDEASSAYKSIDTVMEEQLDLVTLIVKLQPLAVIKG
jgi:tRNA-splicing ligase RtcB